MRNHIHVLGLIPGGNLKQPLSKTSLLKAVKTLYSKIYAAALAGHSAAKRGLASIYAICQGKSKIPLWSSVAIVDRRN